MVFDKNEFKKRLYSYALMIVKLVDSLPKNSVGHVLGGQLLRSGTSITGNYVEAKSASSRKDFVNFYQHALKSANESKLWLCLLRDSDRIKKDIADQALKETDEISRILARSIITLKQKI